MIEVHHLRVYLAAENLHPEGGIVVPCLDVHSDEARPDGVLQVGELHAVAVPVGSEHLRMVKVIWQNRNRKLRLRGGI